jgi:hypothetical protein
MNTCRSQYASDHQSSRLGWTLWKPNVRRMDFPIVSSCSTKLSECTQLVLDIRVDQFPVLQQSASHNSWTCLRGPTFLPLLAVFLFAHFKQSHGGCQSCHPYKLHCEIMWARYEFYFSPIPLWGPVRSLELGSCRSARKQSPAEMCCHCGYASQIFAPLWTWFWREKFIEVGEIEKTRKGNFHFLLLFIFHKPCWHCASPSTRPTCWLPAKQKPCFMGQHIDTMS